MMNAEVDLTLDQERALQLMRSGKNIFLSGGAGTGKSFLVDQYISENDDKNIFRFAWAPTEMHRVGEYDPSPIREMEQADIIIIDNINKCRIDAFEYLIRTYKDVEFRKRMEHNREHYDKQIILVGDFYQAQPTMNRDEKVSMLSEWGLMRSEDLLAFNSTLWDELEMEDLILKTPHCDRDESEFLENLHRLQAGQDTKRSFKVVFDFYDSDEELHSPMPKVEKVDAQAYGHWSDSEDQQLRNEWAEGYLINEIARIHDRTIGAVRAQLLK